jgi:hypothetical protein
VCSLRSAPSRSERTLRILLHCLARLGFPRQLHRPHLSGTRKWSAQFTGLVLDRQPWALQHHGSTGRRYAAVDKRTKKPDLFGSPTAASDTRHFSEPLRTLLLIGNVIGPLRRLQASVAVPRSLFGTRQRLVVRLQAPRDAYAALNRGGLAVRSPSAQLRGQRPS